ncbi:hypothetical protein EC991_000645 [Linnemannia zychae]|nr:hypothetical protein EC991_000645 [Linnemannia zychae]
MYSYSLDPSKLEPKILVLLNLHHLRNSNGMAHVSAVKPNRQTMFFSLLQVFKFKSLLRSKYRK